MHDPRVRFRLADFRSIRPRHQGSQQEALAWLARAHTEAEARLHAGDPAFNAEEIHGRMGKFLRRYGCSPERIAHRASEIEDFMHFDWERMEIFRLREHAEGVGISVRSEFHARATERVFRSFYADEVEPPDDLIHVTCTGYVSPSAPQRLIEEKGWHERTRATHVYHMGCYAAFPALRVAAGFLSMPRPLAGGSPVAADLMPPRRRCDIVHTELCSLHFNPTVHTPEQFVVQSLFADGYIRYSLIADGLPADAGDAAALTLLALREEMVPGTLDSMTWELSQWGMRMTLARDVPDRIAGAVREFFCGLYAQAGMSFDDEVASSVFAIHPGGPKIIDRVQEILRLADAQVAASRAVLRECGNMSSATLPHVWMAILADAAVAPGTPVAAIAFGPGLTVSGALLRKEG